MSDYGRESEGNGRRWKVERRVSLEGIIAVIVTLVAVGANYFGLQGDLKVLAERLAGYDTRLQRVEYGLDMKADKSPTYVLDGMPPGPLPHR
jgi:hypothetical protein